MNAGGDRDRDDFGLPPVDIEVPDDARELDREVQAYYRELRALRRRRRAIRLRAPLTREGMVLPVLAGCLILALITSTLLITFAADQTGIPPGAVKFAPLPPAAIVRIGTSNVPLRTIAAAGPSVLTLVPRDCQCGSALRQLTGQAGRAKVAVYLVGTGAAMPQLARLARQTGTRPPQVADDTRNVLGTSYGQDGLTAILVRRGGSVTSVVGGLTQPARLKAAETGLRQLGTAPPPSR